MKRILITGANRGIGLELALHYHKQGNQVIGTGRANSPDFESQAFRTIPGIDVTHPDSLLSLQEALEGQPIDILINNAGLLVPDNIEQPDAEAIRRQLEVNAIAPVQVTKALRKNLGEGSKIAFITSRMGSIADNSSGGYYGYRMSKAALNAAAMSITLDLKPQGIAVGILHPGFVRTDMTGKNGQLEPSESAALLAQRIEEISLENTGKFVHANGEPLPW